MICKSCGKPIDNGSNFCGYCGSSTVTQQRTQRSVKGAYSKAVKIAIAVLVWFIATALIGIIGAWTGVNQASGLPAMLYWIIFALAPATLATMIIVGNPQTKSTTSPIHKDNATLKSDNVTKTKIEYILNPQTMVFHRKSCKHAQHIYGTQTGRTDSRSAAISVGYRPCKYCKP